MKKGLSSSPGLFLKNVEGSGRTLQTSRFYHIETFTLDHSPWCTFFLSMLLKKKYALLSRNGICREYAFFWSLFLLRFYSRYLSQKMMGKASAQDCFTGQGTYCVHFSLFYTNVQILYTICTLLKLYINVHWVSSGKKIQGI